MSNVYNKKMSNKRYKQKRDRETDAFGVNATDTFVKVQEQKEYLEKKYATLLAGLKFICSREDEYDFPGDVVQDVNNLVEANNVYVQNDYPDYFENSEEL